MLTYREAADFFIFALETCCRGSPLLPKEKVTLWVDGIIASTDVPTNWMLDLSFAKNLDDILSHLRRVPGTPQPWLAISVFIAYLHRLWRNNEIQRNRMCYLLYDCEQYVEPEHRNSASEPDSVLGFCLTSELPESEVDLLVNKSIEEFCQKFLAYEYLIPNEV